MRIMYAREKLGVAVDHLASGTATIKERLERAWLECHVLRTGDFPPATQPRFAKIWEAMNAKKPFQASIAAMTDDEASDVARQIVELQALGESSPPFEV